MSPLDELYKTMVCSLGFKPLASNTNKPQFIVSGFILYFTCAKQIQKCMKQHCPGRHSKILVLIGTGKIKDV